MVLVKIANLCCGNVLEGQNVLQNNVAIAYSRSRTTSSDALGPGYML